MRRALERRAFLVAEATDAATAARVAARDHPDVCLVDTELPGDALALLPVLARTVPQAKVVMFAPSPSEEEFLACVEAGASGYLAKTIEPSRLAHALRRVPDGEAAVPRAFVAPLIDRLRERARRRERPGLRELTGREFEVLELLSRGLSTHEIADRLYVEQVTVRTHVASILRKLGVEDRASAVSVLTGR